MGAFLDSFDQALLLGAGVSHASVAKLLNHLKLNFFVASDGWTDKDLFINLEFCKETLPLKSFHWKDFSTKVKGKTIVLKSPGIPFDNPGVATIPKELMIGEIELGYHLLPPQFYIGITGTNGKTTTARMLNFLLEDYGVKTFLGGNIGKPFCDLAFEDSPDVVILELSSFQLELVKDFHCDYAGITNFSFHHGEHHRDVKEYWEAKKRISWKTRKTWSFYSPDEEIENFELINQEFEEFKLSLGSKKFKFPGEFNLKNLLLASKLAQGFLEETGNLDSKRFDQCILNCLELFELDPYRLQRVPSNSSNQFYNDSKSTNFDSTIAAVKSFSYPVILIMGGKLRGQNDSIKPFLDELNPNVKDFIFIGESGEMLLNEAGRGSFFKELEEVISYIKKLENEIVVFSPAFPSFDQYKDYLHRGRAFEELVSNLDS